MTAPVVIRPPVPEDELVYTDHVEFFDRFLSHIYARDPELEPGWCPEWRAHPAAEYAVTCLWRAWEKLQLDPGPGQASWLVNLANPAMRELFDERGPFAGCTADKHTPVARSLGDVDSRNTHI